MNYGFQRSNVPVDLSEELMQKIKNEILRRSGFKTDSEGKVIYDEDGRPIYIENNHLNGPVLTEYIEGLLTIDDLGITEGSKITAEQGARFVQLLL